MPKRGENIHKRKDGRWEGRYKTGTSLSGKTQYKSIYGKTYNEVKLKMKKYMTEPDKNNCPSKDLSFSEVIKLWMASNSIRFKGATENKYQNIIDTHINPEIGNMRMSKINSATINTFLDSKLQNGRIDGNGGLSSSYVRSIMLIINAAIKYAEQEELCTPLKTQIHKPPAKKPQITVLRDEDRQCLETYLSTAVDYTGLGVLISLHTGLRIGEVCALKWDDIDVENRIIHVKHTIARIKAGSDDNCKSKLIIDRPKTQTSFRAIPIDSVLLKSLVEAKELSTSPYVVSDTDTFVSPRTFEYRYHRLLDKLNVERINYHSLRHSFATRCIEVGVDVKTLSEILGHANVNITLNTYVHSSMDMKRAQLEKIIY